MAQTESYEQAYKQVVAILDRLPAADRSKLPDEVYEFYKKNMDESFEWEYDDTLPPEEQNLLRKTNAVMVKIFRDYFATPKQKEQLEKVLEKNEKIVKKQRYEKMIINMIDTEKTSTAYAEVLAFIDALGDSYKNKIPKGILDNLEKKKDKTFHKTYDRNDTNPDLSHEALALIAGLNLEYWCEDEQEKARLRVAYDRNEKLAELRRYQRLRQQEE